ncbi:MAG: hypothetical protein U1D30_11615 [Planctomycetota bacterium]
MDARGPVDGGAGTESCLCALATPAGFVDGYEQAAIEVAALPGGASILIDASGTAILFFSVGTTFMTGWCAEAKSHTYASYVQRGFTSFVNASRHRTKTAAVRRKVSCPGKHRTRRHRTGQLLRQTVEGENFRLVKRLPIETRGDMEIHVYLDVYEYLKATDPKADALELQFPGLNKTIRVPLRRLE